MVYKCWLRTNLALIVAVTKDLIVNDKGMVNELLSTSRAATNASEVAKVDGSPLYLLVIQSVASSKRSLFYFGSFQSNNLCSGRTSEEDKDSSMCFHDF